MWGVGAAMYELLTHDRATSRFFRAKKGAGGEAIGPITTNKDPEYSSELRDLIRLCLRPQPQDRIKVAEVQLRITIARRKLEADGLKLRGADISRPHPTERLYYRSKEIEKMSAGNFKLTDPYIDSPNLPEAGLRHLRESTVRFPNRHAKD